MRRLILGLALCVPLIAHAADVTMAVRTDAESIDPHFHVYTPNSAVARHIFDGLTQVDARGLIQPALASSWQAIGDDVWEFKLRPGVLFHDGGRFTAADVVFTMHRAPNVPNSPSSYGQYTKTIASVGARSIWLGTSSKALAAAVLSTSPIWGPAVSNRTLYNTSTGQLTVTDGMVARSLC